LQIKKSKADALVNVSAIINVAAKDFYSKRFLNVLKKGRIQRPLSPPPSPPLGSPIAHLTFLSPAPVRRFRPSTSAKRNQPVSREEEEEGEMIPLQNMRMATGGRVGVEAEPLNDAPSGLFTIREEEETEADL